MNEPRQPTASGAVPGRTDFAGALDAAILARGHTLKQLVAQLSVAGTPVTTAALSYWRSGRRRPERKASLAALDRLEHILDLPAGELSSRLPPRKARGRNAHVPDTEVVPEVEVVEQLMAELGLSVHDGLLRLGIHDWVEIDHLGRESRHLVRLVLQAERDGADRFAVLFHQDGDTRATPSHPRPVRGCALGRLVNLPDRSLLAAEILLDHPLLRGEQTVIELELLTAPGGDRGHRHERAMRIPLKHLVVEVSFDQTHLPAGAQRYGLEGEDAVDVADVPIRDGRLTVAWNDVPRGRCGVRWWWPDEDPPDVAGVARA